MKKIRNKITISITALLIILISILLAFFDNLLEDTYLKIIKREMSEKIEFIDYLIHQETGLEITSENKRLSRVIKELSSIIELRITIVGFDGRIVADSYSDADHMDNHRYRIEIKDAISNKTGESIRYSNTLNIDMLYLAKSKDKYIVRLAKPLNEIRETWHRLRNAIIFTGIIIIFIAVITIAIISRKITNPISETRDFAVAFSNGDYSRRIQNYSEDEIGTLQKALNRMAERTAEEINKQILEHNKLKVTIESISDGIAVIGNNKHILIANRAFAYLLEINSEVVDRIYFEIIRGSSFNSKIEYSLAHGKNAHFQEKFHNNTFCDIFVIPIKEEKSMQGILLVLHDVTEKKKIDQLKTDLIGNLSHELKTPIAILKGYLETISTSLKEPELCAEFISKALKNIDRQDSIINDMLKLNMLETMKDFAVENINLKEIISNCINILEGKAISKNIVIESDIGINREIKGNKFLAEEVFFNIITNAINYTNAGGRIKITAGFEENKTIVSVADTGIGIPEESLGRIFERFYRVDKSRSRATGGTGLGLSIVKHAVELLKWDIDVISDSRGTTFYIKI